MFVELQSSVSVLTHVAKSNAFCGNVLVSACSSSLECSIAVSFIWLMNQSSIASCVSSTAWSNKESVSSVQESSKESLSQGELIEHVFAAVLLSGTLSDELVLVVLVAVLSDVSVLSVLVLGVAVCVVLIGSYES